MNKSKFCQIMIAALMGTVFVNNAQAIIIDHGGYLSDTESGLDWFDVTSSTNLSYNYVSSQFGVGGQFEGWRYALSANVNELASNFLGHSIATGSWQESTSNLLPLIDMLGITAEDVSYVQVYEHHVYSLEAMTGDVMPTSIISSDILRVYNIIDPTGNIVFERSFYVSDYSNNGPQISYPLIGSFLIRQSSNIPEPTALSLLGLGLLGLGWSRTRRAR